MASATIVTLPQMVDLALNSPEVGIVNFTVLHSLLHVIVKQLDLADTNVEFRGSDSERLQSYIANARPGPLLTLTEYTVGEEGSDKGGKKKSNKGLHGTPEKGKTDEEQTEKLEPGQSDSQNKVIVVESAKDIAEGPTVVVTKTHFDKLKDDVKKMGKKVKELSELPANSALIGALRSENPENTPVLDMFQILNLTKRLDAAELTMQKLASLMEDLAKRGSVSAEEAEEISEKAKELRESFDDTGEARPSLNYELDKRVKQLEDAVLQIQADVGTVPKGGGAVQVQASVESNPNEEQPENTSGKKRVSEDSGTESKGSGKYSPTKKGSPTNKPSPPKKSNKKRKPSADDSELAEEEEADQGTPSNEDMAAFQQELTDLKETLDTLVGDMDEFKRLLSGDSDAADVPPELRLNQLEIKFNDCEEQLNSLDQTFCRQVEMLQKRIVDLERDTGELTEKVILGLNAGDAGHVEGQTMGELYNKILQIQEDLGVVTENGQRLLEDREEKQSSLDTMMEQIELLKTTKADREDLEDALADKADACMVNRKVSVEQFDAACGDMTRAIEDSLSKLSQQEDLWNQALEEIQKEIGNKLDKMELVPLRDYINKKLRGLQDKFKSLTALKKDHEAAGTKSKFLRDVNCISCDKDVVMRKEIDSSLFPKAPPLPPTKNMAPYLAYELDQLRKQQKLIPPKKDLNMFENALKSAKTPRGPDHLCNRYCGGSHTITTPQQRVTRLGHFLEQWGPEVTPVNDTMIKGSDGHMYRGRDDTTAWPADETKSLPSTIAPDETIAPPKATSTPVHTPPLGSGGTPAKRTSMVRHAKGEGESKPAQVGPGEAAETPEQESADEGKRKSSLRTGANRRSRSSLKRTSKPSIAKGELNPIEEVADKISEEPVARSETGQYVDEDV